MELAERRWAFGAPSTSSIKKKTQRYGLSGPGVFSTRAPVRPNLIALTRCTVLSVKDNVIEIDNIDAFPDTPVLDIKRVIEAAY